MLSLRGLVAVVAAACAALIGFLLLDESLGAALAKVIASTGFVVIALRAGALLTTFGRLLLLGLLLSWCGDVFLIGTSRAAFLWGLGAFLLGHLAYTAAFTVRGIETRWTGIAAIPIVLVAVAVSTWLTPFLQEELVVPVRAYTAVISVMLITAFGTHFHAASRYIVGGALMFFVSDLSVAALRLVETSYPTYVWGLPLYYGGQVLLALSVSQSRSH